MADFRTEYHDDAMRQIRNAPGVRANLYLRAKRMTDQAGDGFLAVMPTGQGRSRARAFAMTATEHAKRAEAKDRRLTTAIDAGRG